MAPICDALILSASISIASFLFLPLPEPHILDLSENKDICPCFLVQILSDITHHRHSEHQRFIHGDSLLNLIELFCPQLAAQQPQFRHLIPLGIVFACDCFFLLTKVFRGCSSAPGTRLGFSASSIRLSCFCFISHLQFRNSLVFTKAEVASSFGWVYWSTRVGSAVMTTGGAAATVISGSSGTLGQSNTLTLSRYTAEATHTLTASCGSASMTIAQNVAADSYSWTLPVA